MREVSSEIFVMMNKPFYCSSKPVSECTLVIILEKNIYFLEQTRPTATRSIEEENAMNIEKKRMQIQLKHDFISIILQTLLFVYLIILLID